MVASNRTAAITETLKWEGGYSNHAADPGGATNYGITIHDVRKYIKKDATPADVKALTKQQAINIYTTKYWKTPYYDCDKLASGVDLAVFDFGVNSGPSRAKKYLDASVGGSSIETINKLCDKRLAFVKGLSTWPVFGAGWSNRIAGIRKKAIQMSQTPSVKAEDAAAGGAGATGGLVIAQHADKLSWTEIALYGAGAVAIVIGIYYFIKWIKQHV